MPGLKPYAAAYRCHPRLASESPEALMPCHHRSRDCHDGTRWADDPFAASRRIDSTHRHSWRTVGAPNTSQ